VNGQAESELALGNQPWWQGRDRHTRFATAAGVLGTHRAAADQLGWNQVDFFRDFFPDALWRETTVGAGDPGRLQRYRLGFQHWGHGMTGRTALEPAPALIATFFLEHLLAQWRGLLRFLAQVVRQLIELSLLLGGKVFRLGTEKLATQFGDLGLGLR
jgi:hypothetical protein